MRVHGGYPAHKLCYATAMTIILRLFAWGLAAALILSAYRPGGTDATPLAER